MQMRMQIIITFEFIVVQFSFGLTKPNGNTNWNLLLGSTAYDWKKQLKHINSSAASLVFVPISTLYNAPIVKLSNQLDPIFLIKTCIHTQPLIKKAQTVQMTTVFSLSLSFEVQKLQYSVNEEQAINKY